MVWKASTANSSVHVVRNLDDLVNSLIPQLAWLSEGRDPLVPMLSCSKPPTPLVCPASSSPHLAQLAKLASLHIQVSLPRSHASLLSIAVVSTVTKSNLEGKG